MSQNIGYKEPEWAGRKTKDYSFQIIKNGVIIDEIDVKDKSCLFFGRAPDCDFFMEHASVSRYHAILQFDKNGFAHLYDQSTHGTILNKKRIGKHCFERLDVGSVIKFGESSRVYIFCGPGEAEEEEKEVISSSTFKKIYLQDPKAFLAKWLKSNGFEDPVYSTSILSDDNFESTCFLFGNEFYGSSSISTLDSEKKCALDICEYLDNNSFLVDVVDLSATKRKFLEEDLLEEENLYDRTTRKKTVKRVENFDSLMSQLTVIREELSIKRINKENLELKKNEYNTIDDNEDEMDKYIFTLKQEEEEKELKKLKIELERLELEEKRLVEMIKITGIPFDGNL